MEPTTEQNLAQDVRIPAQDLHVCIVSASGQNVFFAELLDAIADALRDAGVAVERSVDRFPSWRDEHVYLFVPHEYMPLVAEEAHPTDAHLTRSVIISTEQPGTNWFEQDASVASRAAAAVDINELGMRELKRRGVNVGRLQLGYIPAWDTWRGEDKQQRPIDVTFMGGYTERRARALARCGLALADRRAELILTETLFPHVDGAGGFLAGEQRWSILRQSKLIINVHRSDLGYLEWVRVIGAMMNGCVVLTEHSIGFDPLIPGEHFVSASYDNIPFALDALLADPARLREISQAAYHFLRDRLHLADTMVPLLKAIERVVTAPTPHEVVVPPPTMSLPLELDRPSTEYERIMSQRSDMDRVKAAVKDLVLGQKELRRQIRELVDRADGVLAREDNVEHFGPRDSTVRVSVILTVYNYASVVRDAIQSVAGNDYSGYELIVIDDCSTDESLEVVRNQVARYPWMPATLVARGHNQGLAAARNCGIDHARGELVFILDADNMIYPHALARLSAALDEHPGASFAYGIIEVFGSEGACDLMGWQHWDPERLRYGNYIDAMAMIRRSALLDAGGYTHDSRLHGWEDYALWCAFATRGMSGIRVPEILTRYRRGTYSMISTTNIDGTAAWGALVDQNPFLIA